MTFSSPLFLFAFLPVFLALYWATPTRWLNITALLASLLFYSWGEPVFVLVALGSAVLDFVVVRALAATTDVRRRRILVITGVVANIGLLVYFKYTNFMIDTANQFAENWFSASLPTIAQIALPIGVSFIVFEKITYIVDVNKGTCAPARNLLDYLLYVFLFPKLLAGPIVKYHDIVVQLTTRSKRFQDIVEGLQRFVVGLAMKVLIADPMGEVADMVFAPGPEIGFKIAWAAAFAFSLQIYFDFAGYSSMAIGLARMMGFRLMENFNHPYLAVGFGDFWRRWHISLSSWIREYLYVPLGGSRVSPQRLYFNLWLCFLVSGLWHGAAWTFVAWGAYHGLHLTLDRLFLKRWLMRLPRLLSIALTFLAVTIGWILFRAPDFSTAASYFQAMLDPDQISRRAIFLTTDHYWTFAVGLLVCFLPGVPQFESMRRSLASKMLWPALTTLLSMVLLLAAITKAVSVGFQPFIYFRF